MKAIKLLAGSLLMTCLATVILIQSGVLVLSEDVEDAITNNRELLQSSKYQQDSDQEFSQETHHPPPAGNLQQALPRSEASKEKTLSVAAVQAALNFFNNVANQDTQIETGLQRYLHNQHYSDEQTEKIIRCCFWKGFITLQSNWQPGQTADFHKSFTQEKQLKIAGFQAKGLTLPAMNIAAAEKQFSLLFQLLENGPDKETIL